jgi:4,5-DOPA dioxygenase extradiol
VTDSRIPALFVSHGAPTVALIEDEYTAALQRFGAAVGDRLKAVIAVSAHWLTAGSLQVTSRQSGGIAHDFRGFQDELYALEYAAPGSPDLAQQVVEMLAAKGVAAATNTSRKLDHGVWIPMRLLHPPASLPVLQLSLPTAMSYREIMRLGSILAPLRNQGVLLLGSGGAVHNLDHLVWHARSGDADPRAVAFEAWLKQQLVHADIEALLAVEERAPHLPFAHPTMEHLLPLFFVIGSSLAGDQVRMVYEGFQYRTLSMMSFALSPAPS